MLISHRKEFIFTKTVKTAGTSVESYFERYCMPDGEWSESHGRDEYVSDAGIIGRRSADTSGATWFNHMSAERIRDQIGCDIWNRYFKFTVVRNPFDKMISGFCMHENLKMNYSIQQRAKAFMKRLLGKEKPNEPASERTEVERFRSWVRRGGIIKDRNKYLIDDKECIDYFIRFENLQEGISHVCDQLKIPFEFLKLPEFKKGIRGHQISIEDYYDDETEGIVREAYAWEIERFDYEFPK